MSISRSLSGAKRFRDKVAIITASTSGIGLAIAKRLGQEGAKIVISSRKQANVERTVEELRNENIDALGVRCHVANDRDRKRLFDETIERYGKLNFLVSNAGTNPAVNPLMECEESAWDKIFEVNVKSSFMLTKEAVPYIRKEGLGGSIVYISSIAAYNAVDLIGAYAVSKTALLGLTRNAGKELAKDGIRVNCLAPGPIKTKFLFGIDVTPGLMATVPMNRLAEPEEMASIVSFLISEDASFITGETIVAAGGMLSRL